MEWGVCAGVPGKEDNIEMAQVPFDLMFLAS
uniref:Uncharacterized protein n=1 Tax=Trichinella nativa TaxID=6335 RepID=A0A0V1KJ02_9BILA